MPVLALVYAYDKQSLGSMFHIVPIPVSLWPYHRRVRRANNN